MSVGSEDEWTVRATISNSNTERKQYVKNKMYTIDMVGFYPESAIASMGATSGVYFVFAGIDNGESCTIKRLLYIGKAESQGVAHRLLNHEKMPRFKAETKSPEELFFAYSLVGIDDVCEVENALIKHFDPDINKESTQSFTSIYDTIEINIVGSAPTIFSDDRRFVVEPGK